MEVKVEGVGVVFVMLTRVEVIVCVGGVVLLLLWVLFLVHVVLLQ